MRKRRILVASLVGGLIGAWVFPAAYWVALVAGRLPRKPNGTNGMPTVFAQFSLSSIGGIIVGVVFLLPLLLFTQRLNKPQAMFTAELSAIASVMIATMLTPWIDLDGPLAVLIACTFGVGAYSAQRLAR